MRAHHDSDGLYQEVSQTETVYLRFLSGRCVRAEPATRFTSFGVFGFRRSLEAILPTDFDLFSFWAIMTSVKKQPSMYDGSHQHRLPWLPFCARNGGVRVLTRTPPFYSACHPKAKTSCPLWVHSPPCEVVPISVEGAMATPGCMLRAPELLGNSLLLAVIL